MLIFQVKLYSTDISNIIKFLKSHVIAYSPNSYSILILIVKINLLISRYYSNGKTKIDSFLL